MSFVVTNGFDTFEIVDSEQRFVVDRLSRKEYASGALLTSE